MRKTFLLAITALVALMAASCQKEELGRVLTATIEQYEHNADSKAYINADNYACWENGDEVSINGTTHTISINDDAQTATITNTQGLSGDLLAFYPASMVSNLSASGGTVSLPHLQTYETTTDANGTVRQKINNPMAAYCPAEGSELKFRNLGALLKVTISTSQDIRAIQVRGIENQMLCGKALLTFDNAGMPALRHCTDGVNSVTLQIPENASTNGTYYIVVPANSNFDDLTIALLLKDGNTYTTTCKTGFMGQSLPRNHIGAISHTPNGNDGTLSHPDWMIRYTATAEVTPYNTSAFGANLVSNTFSNGNGILLCDRPLTTIGKDAFFECTSLTSISLPAGVTSIGNYAFQNCHSLTSISLPAGVTSIGKYAFSRCSHLTSIDLPEGVTSIGDNTFEDCSTLTTISLPAGVTSIGSSAFSGCSSLASIDLPESLTSIRWMAFNGCSSLTSITLPAGVTSIGDWAFQQCTSLTSISLPTGVTSIGTGAFKNCIRLYSISLLEGVTSIGEKAFEDCSSLTSISLPESLTSIGNKAFNGCSSLTSIDLPEGVTSIGESAFYYCNSLTSISLPESLTSIGESAFNGCSSLTSISLPAEVTSIGASAFSGCSRLDQVDCYAIYPPLLGSDAFSNIHSRAKLHVRSNAGDYYSSWSEYFGSGIEADL